MPISQYYVRPVNGADVAGQGTSHATAYKTRQFASDDIGGTHGRDAVNGDQINICDEGPSVSAAPWNFAGYGVPTTLAPLVLRGYTTVANDGGIGDIDAGGVGLATFPSYTSLIDLRLHNSNATLGAGQVIAIRCEFDHFTTAANIFDSGSLRFIKDCYFHDNTLTTIIMSVSYSVVEHCYFANNDTPAMMYLQIASYAANNLIGVSGTRHGIYNRNQSNIFIIGNNIYSAGGTGMGILHSNPIYGGVILNNVVAGFSGVGGRGISVQGELWVYGHNSVYNCATPFSVTADVQLDLGNNNVLAADPFVNAAGGDFSLTVAAQALLRSQGWPSTFLGAALTDTHLTPGVVQYGAGGGGGGGPVIGSRIIRGLSQ